MLSVHIDNVEDVAVVQCEGRIVHSDAAYTLRNAVTLQTDARAVVLDLSGVEALEGGGSPAESVFRPTHSSVVHSEQPVVRDSLFRFPSTSNGGCAGLR